MLHAQKIMMISQNEEEHPINHSDHLPMQSGPDSFPDSESDTLSRRGAALSSISIESLPDDVEVKNEAQLLKFTARLQCQMQSFINEIQDKKRHKYNKIKPASRTLCQHKTTHDHTQKMRMGGYGDIRSFFQNQETDEDCDSVSEIEFTGYGVPRMAKKWCVREEAEEEDDKAVAAGDSKGVGGDRMGGIGGCEGNGEGGGSCKIAGVIQGGEGS